jgi:hypothetical protein
LFACTTFKAIKSIVGAGFGNGSSFSGRRRAIVEAAAGRVKGGITEDITDGMNGLAVTGYWFSISNSFLHSKMSYVSGQTFEVFKTSKVFYCSGRGE